MITNLSCSFENLSFTKQGRVTSITSDQFVKVNYINSVKLSEEFLPIQNKIFIPCTWQDSNYNTFQGDLVIDKGTLSVYYNSVKRTEGWVRVNGCYVTKN